MSTRLSIALLVLLSSLTVATLARGQSSGAVNIAIGKPGSKTFVFGTELWAMSQITLKPGLGIDLSVVEVIDEDDRLARLLNAEVEAALVSKDVPRPLANHLRTVVAFWPKTGFINKTKPARFLVHKNMSDDVVYQIAKAIFENPSFFTQTAETGLGITVQHQATVVADLPIHPGASRYYDEVGVGFNSRSLEASAPSRAEIDTSSDLEQPRKFTNFDDEALNDEERSQIAAACRQALEQGALSLVLGDLSSRGCEVYQSYLEESNDDRSHDLETMDAALYPSSSGQGGPAVALDDVVSDHHAPLLNQDLRSVRQGRQPTM